MPRTSQPSHLALRPDTAHHRPNNPPEVHALVDLAQMAHLVHKRRERDLASRVVELDGRLDRATRRASSSRRRPPGS